ncbi:MAG: bifunctional phosphopantothenoylcysteine decarboxylase/phosphopantothenate--cysteine ligase CoaBC [Candidatus Helarchaeota archaeon]
MYNKHSSKTIIGTEADILKGKKIALCVTGSVAATQAPIIARNLMRLGAEVYPVMTKAATELLNPNILQWATGNEVITKLTGRVEHITLAGDEVGHVDLVLVCPATANTISKIACGIDDTTVTTVVTTAFGTGIPIVIVPAMHQTMFKHPIVIDNIKKLKNYGVKIIEPRIEEKKAKLARIDEITQFVVDELVGKTRDLEGLKFLITTGPTREYIDAIRYISNPASGKMGLEIAINAKERGADVTLIYGVGTSVEIPSIFKSIKVVSTEDLANAIVNELKSEKYDAFICSAAISDFTPEKQFEGKVSSRIPDLSIKLKPTPKCIDMAREVDDQVYICGFKAEYHVSEEELIKRARKKMQEAKANLMVANDVGRERRGFGTNTNEVYLITENNVIHLPLDDKKTIAKKILDFISIELKNKKKLN